MADATSSYTIRLRGPWNIAPAELHDPAAAATNKVAELRSPPLGTTVRMPLGRDDYWALVRERRVVFVRTFHSPTGLETLSSVALRVESWPGVSAIRLNGCRLDHDPS